MYEPLSRRRPALAPRSAHACRAILVAAAAYLIAIVFLPSVPSAKETDRADRARIIAALVAVSNQASALDLLSPWQKVGVERYEGSGVVIEGRRILTAAHVVADHVEVFVKRQGTTKRYAASVAFSGDESDLAILEVDDERFFEGVEPLVLGPLPRLGDSVTAYGFPLGGDSISITAGIVSRIEIGTYSHSGEELLQAQVDAALNAGNSGGPVVANGKLVGIASEVLESAENVGYVVPAPVIEHFMRDIEDGRVDGFPDMGIDAQPTENKALRASLGLDGREGGALVVRVDADSTAAPALLPGDVLLSVDGLAIANDLTIEVAGLGRVAAKHAVLRRQVGETVGVVLARDGERLERDVVLRNTPPLVPATQYGPRSYLVYGGLVFQPLTRDFVELFEDPPSDMAELYLFSNVRTAERAQIIVLSNVLPAGVNRGYEEFEDEMIAEVDGRVPRDLAALARMLDEAEGEYVRIVTRQGARLVLDRRRAIAAAPRILERYGIRADRSADLRAR